MPGKGSGRKKSMHGPAAGESRPGIDDRDIFENTGTAMAIIEEDSFISKCNSEFARFWGYTKEEIENRKKWTQIVADQDLEKMREYHALRRKSPSAAPRSYEFMAIDKCGRKRNAHLTISLIEGTSKSIASLIDITEMKKTEEQLHRRDSILEAVSFMAQKLMNSSFEGCLREVLSRLGSAAAASRIEIYRHYPEENCVGLLDQWVSEELAPVFGKPYYGKLNWLELGYARWAEMLLDDKVISGNAKDFPENERVFLDAMDVKSTVAVPIFVSNLPWGFISFDDCISEREWSAAEMDALKAAGGIIASAIERQIATAKMEQKNAERERAEASLREREEFLSSLIENMMDAVLILDWDGTVLFWNRAAESLSESSPRQGDVLNFIDFIHPDSLDYVLRNMKLLQDNGKEATLNEYKIVTRRGSVKSAESFSTKINFGGKSAAMIVARDITDRRKAEEALKQNEELLRNVFDNMLDSILIVDWDGTILFGNNAVVNLIGLDSPREGLGRNLVEFIHPDSLEQAARNLMLVRQGEEGFLAEHTVITKNGEQKIVEVTGRRIIFNGKSADLIGLRDITERRRAENALRESEELFRKLVSNMLDSLLIINLEGKIIFANEAALKLGEFASMEDVVGRQISRFMSPDDFEKIIGYIGKRYENFIYEMEIRTGAGNRKYVEVLGNPIRFRGSEAVIANLRDITERKRSEQQLLAAYVSLQDEIRDREEAQRELKLYQEQLEEKVSARTVELKKANEELEKAYAELKASEEVIVQQEKLASIGQLAAGIAHEIKNPLAIILQGTEFIKSCVDSEFLADAAERVKKSAYRADNIIKGLLSFSRQAGINLETGDLTSVLNESISLVGHQLTRRNIKVIREFSEVPTIKYDGNQLKQVFINLLINAIESMDAGGPLKIGLMKEPGGAREVLIRITDKGCGIEKEIISKIFDPFFTTKRKSGGTGLGLSVTKGIIEKHNGRISVDSVIGVGTEISVYLPFGSAQGDGDGDGQNQSSND